MRFVAFTIILAFGSLVYSQSYSDYHYYQSKKIHLDRLESKSFLVVRQNLSDAELQVELGATNMKVLKRGVSAVRTSIVAARIFDSPKWIMIDGESSTIQNKDWIIYEAPFFLTEEGVEVGLSNLFYVKLREKRDTILLQNLAEDNNVEVLGHNKFMPLWYTLSCSKQSMGNALEMANHFYETDKFEASEPDLMVDDLLFSSDPYYQDQWQEKTQADGSEIISKI